MTLYNLLKNQIEITRVPFSDRGSRLLVYQHDGQSGLYVKLAERLMDVDSALEAYLQRPPFIRDLNLLGSNGDTLDFDVSSSPALLQFKTDAGMFELTFRDETTLAFGLPDNSASGIRFKVQVDNYLESDSRGISRPVRVVSYTTNGTLIKEQTALSDDGYTVELLFQSGQNGTLQLHITDTPVTTADVPPFSTIRIKAMTRWQNWFKQIPPVAEPYMRTYAYAWWVMANNLVSPLGNIKYEAMMPSKSKYIGLWLWDSALHALALRHADPELARNQLRTFLEYQLPDGMLPDVVFDEGIVTEIDHPIRAMVTKPPILAWVAMKIHEIAPDPDFLQEIYTPLTRWNAWWFKQSTEIIGLAQYNHPYSSGLDDTPLWDVGMPVVSPDLNTYLFNQMKALGQISTVLGREKEAHEWESRNDALLKCMIEYLWDDQVGVFQAIHKSKLVPVLTPFNLYPLWTNQLPAEIKERVVRHLTDPDEFWGEIMLPTVARNDPKYSPEIMWRGPVWANINYFFISALADSGKTGLSNRLRDITLNLLMSADGIHEYYHAETGKPPSTAAPMFGWSAAVFIDLAIQNHSKEKNSKFK